MYNHDDMKRAYARKRVKDGYHYGVLTEAKKYEKEDSPNLMAYVVVQVLKDPDDPSSFADREAVIPQWKVLPLKNPEVADHSVGRREMDGWIPWAAALFPEECAFKPHKKNPRDRNEPYLYRGEEIEKDEYEDCLDDILKDAGNKANSLWYEDEFSEMVGKPFLFKLQTQKNNPNFQNVYPVEFLPKGAELVDPEDCVEVAPQRQS